MAEPSTRTFVCSVLFLDIVEYSRQSVSEQQRLKQRFNTLLGKAMRPVPSRERVTVDTGDGAAVAFLGNPEDAVLVAMAMRDATLSEEDNLLRVRCGLNLGPVRLIKDINGRQNLIGDGINVAQRIMDFADAGQILASRSFVEVVSHLSEDYASLFSYQGQRTDKHSREHRLYAVARDRIAPSSSVHAASTTGGFAATRARRPLSRRVLIAAALLLVLPVVGGVATRLTLEAYRASAAKVAITTAAREAARSPDAQQPAETPETTERQAPEQRHGEAPATVEPAPRKPEAARPKTETAPASTATPARSRAAGGPSRSARIALSVLPWGEVFVDGRSRGISPPLRAIDVTPGKHVIEFRNSGLPSHEERVELKPGEQITLRHRFD